MSENRTRSERLAMLLACGSPGSAAAYHGLTPRYETDLLHRNDPEMTTRPAPSAPQEAAQPPRFAAWISRLVLPFRESIWQRELREREAYLAGAQNIADVETRLRALERAAFSRFGAPV